MKNLSHSILTILITIVFLSGVFWFYQRGGLSSTAEPNFTKDSYQAVFLSNGQVYFGKVRNLSKQYVTLTDTYYLIRGQSIQAQTPEGENKEQTQAAFGLRKLGENEVHGPVDEMVINRDHILFIEEIKDSGPIVQAIKSHKASLTEPASGGEPTVEPSPIPTEE